MDEFEDLQAEARELAARVDEYLQKGSTRSATRVFSQSWRETVPDLPLRFSVMLKQVDDAVILDMLAKLRGGDRPLLALRHRRKLGVIEVVDTVSRKALGLLPAQDAQLLIDLKAVRGYYSPHLSEIKINERGRLQYVAVELVRAEEVEQDEQSPVHFHDAVDAFIQEENN